MCILRGGLRVKTNEIDKLLLKKPRNAGKCEKFTANPLTSKPLHI